MARDYPDDVQAILAEHRERVVETVDALRELVLDTLPADTREVAYRGWHGIGYRHPDAGYVCGIFPLADTARLLFEKGVQLSDPDGVLGGGGSRTRYVEVGDPGAVPADAVRDLLRQALAIGLERRPRL
jgi:hypothetical protein